MSKTGGELKRNGNANAALCARVQAASIPSREAENSDP